MQTDQYDNTIRHFTNLYHMAVATGYIDDKELIARGFPVDLDMNGKEVERTAEISREAYQRAKCLSHEAQIMLRAKQMEEARAKEIAKISLKNTRIQ